MAFLSMLLVGEDACPLFTAATLPTSGTWTDIEYGDGYFVICGPINPSIAYSADGGATWANGIGASTTTDNFFNIAKLGSIWLVIAVNDFGGRKRYQTSTDAVNWSEGDITGIASSDSNKWTGLIAEPVQNVFVMFCDRTSSQNRFYSSALGIIWITHSSLLPSSARWQSVAANSTHIVSVATEADSSDSTKAAYSAIGTYLSGAWTASTLPSPESWKNVIWTGTCFFATARFSTAAARSYDGGATWEAVTLPNGLNNNPVFANTVTGKLFLLLFDLVGTPNIYFTSTDDGTTWTQCSIPNGAWTVGATTGSNHVVISNAPGTADGAYYL